MVGAVIEMGTAACGDHLRYSGKLPIGRSRQTPAGSNGLRDFCWNWHSGNGNHRNGIFWREYEYRARLFPGAYRPRVDRSEAVFGCGWVTEQADYMGFQIKPV